MHLQRHAVTAGAGFYAQGAELFGAQQYRAGFVALGALEIGDEPVDVGQQVDGLLGLPELADGLDGLMGHALPWLAVGYLDHAAALSAVQACPTAQALKSRVSSWSMNSPQEMLRRMPYQ